MRVASRALGQWYPGEGITSASCGSNPCDFTDYLWVSDACSAWLACAGQPAVTLSNVAGQGAASIAGGTASVVGSAAGGLLSNATTDVVLFAVLAAVVVGFLVFEKL